MSKKYKILLSAYACEPNRGSEPGVGWNWAKEIAKRGHSVWVLTRANNKKVIDTYFEGNTKPEDLEFIYYDVPKGLSFWKKGGRGVHLYYYLWQWGIVKIAKQLNRQIKFDLIHHITFVTIHQPSFLYKIEDVPLFYGPGGGGDYVPKKYLKSFPKLKAIKEILIQWQGMLLRFDYFRSALFSRTNFTFVCSRVTKSRLPKNAQEHTSVNLAIGIENKLFSDKELQPNTSLKLLYVGNFLHWKGLHIALQAYQNTDRHNTGGFTLIGKGQFDINKYTNKGIRIINWMPQSQLMQEYQNSDVFVFPSFRDSGGMVVLEALAHSLPVICLKLGGPGQIVDDTCGKAIDINGKDEIHIVEEIQSTLAIWNENPDLFSKLKKGALKRADQFTWDKTVGSVYSSIETQMLKLDNGKA